MRRSLFLLLVLLTLPAEAHAHGGQILVFALGNLASLAIVGAWAVLAHQSRRTKQIGLGLSLVSVVVMDWLIPPRVFLENPGPMLAACFLVPLVCGLLPSALARSTAGARKP